jgi:hypothetical protein
VSAGAEAVLFARYLVGVDPPGALVERYDRACATLFPDPPTRDDAAVLAFALRHPRSIPALDAACALLRPGALLRRKILVMTAVLETTPDGAATFLPRARSPIGLALTIIGVGATAVVHTAAGLVVLYLAQRRGRR